MKESKEKKKNLGKILSLMRAIVLKVEGYLEQSNIVEVMKVYKFGTSKI